MKEYTSFCSPVVVRMTDTSEQCRLATGNQKSKYSPGTDKLKDKAVLGSYLTRSSHINSLDQVTAQEYTAGSAWDDDNT